MKKEGASFLFITLLISAALGAGWSADWGVATPVFAQGREAISGLTKSKDAELTAELEKTWDYLQRRHFHSYVEENMPENPNPALCFICHGSYPHQNAKKTRSMLNMHTIFMACETCHFKYDPKEARKFGFRWYNGTTAIQASQRHYGTKYDPVSGVVLMEGEATLFKITPYLGRGGKYYMIDMRQENPWVQKMLVERDHKFTSQEQAKIKTTIHISIETKGRECGECHAVDTVIPYSQLGFDDERVKDLTGLNIVGMVEKYQKFYIPDIFKQRMEYEAPIIEERAEK